MGKAFSFDLKNYGFDSLARDMLYSFFEQFCVIELIPYPIVGLFTNSSMMVISGISVMTLVFGGWQLIPHRAQLIQEFLHRNVRYVVHEIGRWPGEKFYPFVHSLF